MRFFIISLCAIVFSWPLQAQKPQNLSSLTVIMKGFKSNEGKVRISLFNKEEGYPSKAEKALRRTVEKIENQTAQTVFKNLPFGIYAISVMHDENDNNKVDTNWIGIPNEGVGASNDASGSFGPPSFKDAKFEVNKKEQSHTLKINYF